MSLKKLHIAFNTWSTSKTPRVIGFLLFHLAALPSFGQDSLTVTKNFHFTDGVYLSFEEFQANRPTYRMEDVDAYFFTNPQTFLTQVEAIVIKNSDLHVDTGSIWAISIGGIPYVRLPKGEINKELPTFAALKLRGKICYFTYPDWRNRKVHIAAYNPLNGRPFRTGTVEREQEVVVEKMLNFETGEMADFTLENFLSWIQDDPALVETVKELPPEEKQEKLFKCLLIYVDRNLTEVRGEK
ncbi:MAG: hypothetical protein ACE5FF_09665 [Saprospiraceae bacterium]